ncbi:MAG: CHC2 zinc finger domain-containing protein [Phycisphaerales bacterium]|nr:CHC2 zinc finger domain-containing protein [Phycisphaerales bacterium]
MNIEQAKAIPLSVILVKLGLSPHKQTNKEAWYYSPFRKEKTPSFHVHLQKNYWYDFGEGKGGDIVSFVCAYLAACHESNTVADALRWLGNMQGALPAFAAIDTSDCDTKDASLVFKEAKAITSPGLLQYLRRRGIPQKIAFLSLKEVLVFNKETGKSIYALGLLNEEGGYELRNVFFKGCVGRKDVSFIRGVGSPKTIHVFEGFFDYLSVQTAQALVGDVLILNSIACLQRAIGYIKGFGYSSVYSWLDNDAKGIQATEFFDAFCKTESGLMHLPQNKLYAPHKDVNAWHMHKLGLGA